LRVRLNKRGVSPFKKGGDLNEGYYPLFYLSVMGKPSEKRGTNAKGEIVFLL